MDLVEVAKRQPTGTNQGRHPWELARLDVVDHLLKDHLRNSPDCCILDIGCGDIFFIMQLSSRYPQAEFIAVDIAFTDTLLEMYGKMAAGRKIRLFKTLDEASVQMKTKASVVLLLDVVEHIEDDHGFLKMLQANPAISNETIVMITVPAFQGLFCSHDHFLGHYRRYNNRSLKQTTTSCGFNTIKVGYFFSSLLLPRLLQVFKEKMSKPSEKEHTTGLVEWNKGPFVTSLVKGVLLFDFRFTNFIKNATGLNLPGLSNYIMCKKPA